MHSTVVDLVGNADRVATVAAAAGATVSAAPAHVESLGCVLTNMTTEDLARVRFGGQDSGQSVIVKVVRSPRLSPLWAQIPPQFRDEVMQELPWRAEPDLYASPLPSLLPAGLRMPALYGVDPLDEERIALWLEDVGEDTATWDREDYLLAAELLGRMTGRLAERLIPAAVPVVHRDLRGYFFGRVREGTLPVLRDDATWSHPLVADHADPALRRDLESLAVGIPGLLERLERLPRGLAHGDACPQNLLRPASGGDGLVAIDWTFAGICTIGMDAGQLLAGRAESGELDPALLPGLLDDVVTAYAHGLAAEGMDVDIDLVRLGVVGNLVIRSAFTALPVELLGAPPSHDKTAVFARRARYARFLVDLGLSQVMRSAAG